MRSLMILCLLCGLVQLATPPAWSAPQTTAFTYQGQLKLSGEPYTGPVNLQFRLWDDPIAGAQVAPLVTRNGVPVDNGIFTVELDFGSAFGTEQRWIEVIANGTTLLPRQPVTTAPMAIFALTGLQGPVGPPGATGPQGVPGPRGTPVLVFGGTLRQSHYRTNNATASYGAPLGTSEAFTNLARAEMLVPTDCQASDLRVELVNNNVGYSSATVTLMVNGAASSLACSVNAGSTCLNGSSGVALQAGDQLALRAQPALPPTAISMRESEVRVWLKFGFSCSDPS